MLKCFNLNQANFELFENVTIFCYGTINKILVEGHPNNLRAPSIKGDCNNNYLSFYRIF